ncbi:MAG: decaprenyl-phosphate phosphoribosyltransferase [Dehalococcoidia bacterium]
MGSPNGVISGVATTGMVGQASALVAAMRPKQWAKNLIIFLPAAFTLNLSWDPSDLKDVASILADTGAAFGLFCLLSSGVYLINDLVDLDKDRLHPGKRLRPIASGRLSRHTALAVSLLLIGVSIPLGFLLETGFGVAESVYIGTMALYIVLLRGLVILDVFAIGAGFVTRAVAGALVISADPSPWLYICTGLGALFIGFAKRRQELITLGPEGIDHRTTLSQYSIEMLDHLITMLMASTLIAYILYTFTAENLPSNDAMMFTIPFVAFGIARYFYLIHAKNAGGSPEDILMRDIPIMITVVLWVATTVAVLWTYRG